MSYVGIAFFGVLVVVGAAVGYREWRWHRDIERQLAEIRKHHGVE